MTQYIAASDRPYSVAVVATDHDGETVRTHWRCTAYVIAAAVQRQRLERVGYLTPRQPDPNP